VTVTLTELAQDERGQFRVIGTATLGEGTRKVLGVSTDLDEARELAKHKAERQERWLAANEVHDVDDLDGVGGGHRILKAPDGTIVEATEATVPALLGAGYVEVDGIPQRTNETTGPVGVQRRRGRPPRIPATRALTSDDAERAAAEAELVPTDEM
jgi:hypothetical protein